MGLCCIGLFYRSVLYSCSFFLSLLERYQRRTQPVFKVYRAVLQVSFVYGCFIGLYCIGLFHWSLLYRAVL